MATGERCTSTGKVMYRHYQQAAKALGLPGIRHRKSVGQVPQAFYRCEFCSHFHLTSYSPERTAGIQRCVKRRQHKEKPSQ